MILIVFCELTLNMNVTGIPSTSGRKGYYEATKAYDQLNDITKKDADSQNVKELNLLSTLQEMMVPALITIVFQHFHPYYLLIFRITLIQWDYRLHTMHVHTMVIHHLQHHCSQ